MVVPLAGTAVALAVTGLALSSPSVPANASTLGHRPTASATVTTGFSGFTNTGGLGNFCDNIADAPCDGVPGTDYGTVNQVNDSFNNGGFGNYATGLPSGLPELPNGTGVLANHVVLDGSTATNQGGACPTAGTEGCTGPYMEKLINGQNQQTGFPSNGYTLTIYQYVDPSYQAAAGNANGAGTQFDTDLGISQVNGGVASYGSDNVITTCNDGNGTSASLAFGHGSPDPCGNGGQITAPGWYRYVFLVSNVGGKVFLTARVLSEDGNTTVFDSGPIAVSFDGGVTQATTSNTGGLRYLWWPTLNVDGLPVGYVNYQAGQLQSGHAS